MKVATRSGECEIVPCYSAKTYVFPLIKFLKGRKKKTGWFAEKPVAYDIETTSYKGVRLPDGDGWQEEPYGLMYHWQLCFNDDIITGRTWEEFELFLARMKSHYNLGPDKKIIFYAHNLGFEWQNTQCFLTGERQMFAVKRRTPLSIRFTEGIEFRCSWKLSNMSLQKFVENSSNDYYYIKADGDLDYNVFRTPRTFLSDTERMYCASDVKCLYHAILNRMAEEGDDLETIPLTSTGYVRRLVRGYCDQSRTYRQLFLSCRLTPKTYESAVRAAQGGDTHANRYLSNRIWQNCDSYDVRSSYPYVMCTKKYPVTSFDYFGKIDTMDKFRYCLDNYACMFKIMFKNLRCKRDNIDPYISSDKCHFYDKESKKAVVYDNGRVLSAPYCITTLTDIDFREVERGYDWDSIRVQKMYVAKYGYLPEEIRHAVMDLFREKCVLAWKRDQEIYGSKAWQDLDYLYGKCKNRLNGIFGMLYTNPCHNEIAEDFDTLEWTEKKIDITDHQATGKALNQFYASYSSFLYYPWGIWTTAHARAHLHRLQRAAIGNTGGMVIYWDTDSVKGFNLDCAAIDHENKLIAREAEERKAYVDYMGERYHLGIYEKEKPMNRFITMGAKKYAYEDQEGQLHITISGVNKKLGAAEMGRIENFKKGFTFYKAAALKMYYNDRPKRQVYINGFDYSIGASCSLLDNTYTLGLNDKYEKLLEEYVV